MENQFGKVYLLSRSYTATVLRLKKRTVRAKGRLYPHYYINVPRDLANWIERHPQARDPETGEPADEIPIVALVAPADWHHLLVWRADSWLWNRIPRIARQELEALALDPKGEETILIPAKKTQLEKLGLDTSKPITLEDLLKQIYEKLLTQTLIFRISNRELSEYLQKQPTSSNKVLKLLAEANVISNLILPSTGEAPEQPETPQPVAAKKPVKKPKRSKEPG